MDRSVGSYAVTKVCWLCVVWLASKLSASGLRVASELAIMRGMLVLLRSELSLPWSPTVRAFDACESGEILGRKLVTISSSKTIQNYILPFVFLWNV